jgi:hypothetical protein
MEQSQQTFEVVEQRILETLQGQQERNEALHSDMAEIKHVLKRGFRLHEDD